MLRAKRSPRVILGLVHGPIAQQGFFEEALRKRLRSHFIQIFLDEFLLVDDGLHHFASRFKLDNFSEEPLKAICFVDCIVDVFVVGSCQFLSSSRSLEEVLLTLNLHAYDDVYRTVFPVTEN